MVRSINELIKQIKHICTLRQRRLQIAREPVVTMTRNGNVARTMATSSLCCEHFQEAHMENLGDNHWMGNGTSLIQLGSRHKATQREKYSPSCKREREKERCNA